jgi:hypothetical protein
VNKITGLVLILCFACLLGCTSNAVAPSEPNLTNSTATTATLPIAPTIIEQSKTDSPTTTEPLDNQPQPTENRPLVVTVQEYERVIKTTYSRPLVWCVRNDGFIHDLPSELDGLTWSEITVWTNEGRQSLALGYDSDSTDGLSIQGDIIFQMQQSGVPIRIEITEKETAEGGRRRVHCVDVNLTWEF